MKIQEIKHNHSLTELLKVLLFALIMLAPMFSVAVRCAYVVCNKNAYQSYYGETINEKEYENVNTLTIDNTYTLVNELSQMTAFDNTYTFYVENISDYNFPNISSVLQNAIENNLVNNFRFTNSSNRPLLNIRDSDNNNIQNFWFDEQQFYFTFELVNLNTQPTSYYNLFKKVNYNNYSYLDNVFEYSVSQLENDQLFNWTQQTAIYTGVHAMCTQLGITNTVVPQILVYWFLLSVIYVIIDIILKTFTTLTHMLGSKKA